MATGPWDHQNGDIACGFAARLRYMPHRLLGVITVARTFPVFNHVFRKCQQVLGIYDPIAKWQRGDELHLLMVVPDRWLAEGRVIRVERAPTHFGSLSLRVTGTPEAVQVRFDPLWREPPRRLFLHLPKSRPLGKPVEGLEVITRSGCACQATVGPLRQRQNPPPTRAESGGVRDRGSDVLTLWQR